MADWALCIIAGISLLLSFYSVIANIKLEKEQKRLDDLSLKICMEQLKIAQGQIELEMANQLSSAKNTENHQSDTVTISNVLNVVKEKAARKEILLNAIDAIKPNGKVYITTYEGDGTGIGKVTKSGYQLNT